MTIRPPKAAAALAVLLALAAPAIAQEAAPSDWAHAEPEATTKRWSWLGGTIWIVPHAYLPAVMTEADSKAVVELIDQCRATIRMRVSVNQDETRRRCRSVGRA